MNYTRRIGLLLVLTFSTCSLCAEEGPWYEHPKEHLTIIVDTVSRQLRDTIVEEGDTVQCYFDVRAIYPIVTAGPSQGVVDSLNTFISHFVMKHFDLPPGATIEERVAGEMDSLRELCIVGVHLGGVDWKAVIEYCDHDIFSLKLARDVCISCNGFPYHEYHFHFALPRLEEIDEDSLFTVGSQAYLDSLGELAFRKDRNIPLGVPLRDSGFVFEDDDEFSLSSNFIISDSGVTYVFNAYTIASGAYGMSFAYLTWDQLRPVIRPNGPLGWVLKEN